MPKIEFRGKTYNNEFEMPLDVRQAYNKEKERADEKSEASTKSLTDIVDMSPELKESMNGHLEKWRQGPSLVPTFE